ASRARCRPTRATTMSSRRSATSSPTGSRSHARPASPRARWPPTRVSDSARRWTTICDCSPACRRSQSASACRCWSERRARPSSGTCWRVAASERAGGFARNHRKVRRQEELLWLAGHGFTHVLSLLDSPHNLHGYEEAGLAYEHVPLGRHDELAERLRDVYTTLAGWLDNP